MEWSDVDKAVVVLSAILSVFALTMLACFKSLVDEEKKRRAAENRADK